MHTRFEAIVLLVAMSSICSDAQWSEGVTKPPWSSEQIEVLSFLEAFGYILGVF